MTSYLLYATAQVGFSTDIMQYSMEVIMDTLGLAGEITDGNSKKQDELIDLDVPMSLEV